MSDDGEMWKVVKQNSYNRRKAHRETAPIVLMARGLVFITYNNAAHIVITDKAGGAWDFWPGTGLWIERKGKRRGRGIFNLVKLVKAIDDNLHPSTRIGKQ